MKISLLILSIFISTYASDGTKLLFFIFPQGRPCQIQDSILQEIQFPDNVELTYVSTEVSADRAVFRSYGVRSLPQLILVNSAGARIHHFRPGIHNAESILDILSAKTK